MNTAKPLDDAGWVREPVAGVPVQFLSPHQGTAGIVLALPDPQWPDDAGWQTLGRLFRESNLAAVIPDVRPWWIDRPDPALDPARSPLMFVADELVPWIGARWPEGLRLAVMGVGLGGQGALQLAYRFPQLFPMSAAICPAIDFQRLYDSSPQLQQWFETPERARQETATLRLHPLNWPPHQWLACPPGDWRFDGCERLASKLTSMGIPFEADLETQDGPAYRSQQLRQAIEWIVKWMAEPPPSRGIRMPRS